MGNRISRYTLVVAVMFLSAFGDTVALAQAAPGQRSEAASTANFQSFWALFRKAVLNDDTAAIEAMVSFPLKTKGELDDDPVKAVGKAAFGPLLRTSLREDANMRGSNGSTLDFLRANPVFPKIAVDGGGTQRVGGLLFRLQTNGWKLSMIYRSDEN